MAWKKYYNNSFCFNLASSGIMEGGGLEYFICENPP